MVDGEVVDGAPEERPQPPAPPDVTAGDEADGPAPDGPVASAEPVESRPAPDPTGEPVAQHDPQDVEPGSVGVDEQDPHDTGDPMASVHPIRGAHTMTSPSTTSASMTEINGETLDPHAALSFVSGLKDLADSIVGQIELSVASLTGRGVAGEPIELLTAMQEAFTTASGQCDTAKGHFERHIATQDVVLGDDTLAGTVEGTYVGSAS